MITNSRNRLARVFVILNRRVDITNYEFCYYEIEHSASSNK